MKFPFNKPEMELTPPAFQFTNAISLRSKPTVFLLCQAETGNIGNGSPFFILLVAVIVAVATTVIGLISMATCDIGKS
jgi:hypothetical protein